MINKTLIWILPLALITGVLSPCVYGKGMRMKIKKRSTLMKAPISFQESQGENYSTEKNAILLQKRRVLIEEIKRFILEAKDAEQAGELNLRLGSLYMEDYYALMAKAQQDFDTANSAWDGNHHKGTPPSLDTSEARLCLTKARSVYKGLIQRFSKHERRDEILYFLAISSQDEGKTNEAMGYFDRIVRENPKSKYFQDSLVQLADHYFEKNKFSLAEGYYDKIIKAKYLPLLAYATYKKGWCAYNREAFAETISRFKWVVSFADSESDSSALRIRAEALRDIALPFSDLKATHDAVVFYREQDSASLRTGLETMASIYFDKGVHQECIKINDTLLEIDPNYAKNADYDIQAIESLSLANKEDAALQRLYSKLPVYATHSNWYDLNSGNPAVVQGAFKAYEELTRKYAFRFHAIAQKTGNNALYDKAKAIYAKYIEFFPQTENASKVRFFLAEIQFKQQQYSLAADNYHRVYQDTQAGNLRSDGIRYALSALDRQLNSDRKKAGLDAITSRSTSKLTAKEEEAQSPVPFSNVETLFLSISDEYLNNYPKAKDRADVRYEQAYLRYMHYDLNEAVRGFMVIVQKHPSEATAPSSAYLILDILNRKKDYPKLIAACQKFLEMAELAKPAFRHEVSDILRKAELKRISIAEEKGNFKEAADNYFQYAKSYGTQDPTLYEKALYNAAVNYTKAGLPLPAAETQELFLRRFTRSQYRENVLLQVAKTYETLADFEKSARYFEEFAALYPNNPQSKNAARLAGLYYSGSGHPDRAEALLLRFIHRYPTETKTVEKDLIALYNSQNAAQREFRYYLQARSTRGLSYSEYLNYTLAAAELSARHTGRLPPNIMEEAKRVADRFSADLRKSPKGVEALAKIRFWWVSQRDLQFQRYKLALPQAQLEANLKRKLALLQELEREYGKIASLGNAEWGIGAIYKTAAIYRHMAEAVLAAPVPAELTSAQLDGYRSELKRQMIAPFNEKARSFALSCLDKAQEFGVLSPWTAHCYRLVQELEPGRYPKMRTFYLPPMTLSLQLPPKDAKIETGGIKRFAYPFFSTMLFAPNRQLASMGVFPTSLAYDMARGTKEQSGSPRPTTYEGLTPERRNVLKAIYESEKPEDMGKNISFSFLNTMRLVSAKRAIALITAAIQKDPQNPSLVNLLGLANLEAGKIQAANVCWLSLVAREQATASVWNNLGVAANREGNETQAIAYFQEAARLPGAKEALINLGFIALKYRNGFEAKNHFKKALAIDDDDIPSQTGLAVALLQNREMEEAKEKLYSLAKHHPKDPYLKLSLGYFLVDVEHEGEAAHKIIQEFMDYQSMEQDLTFRQLLMDARRQPVSADSATPD